MTRSLLLSILILSLLNSACALTSHGSRPSTLGQSRRSADMLAVIDVPGPIEAETINSSDWAVDRSGLINLSHERAKAAGLQEGDEPIQIYFHVLKHPERGTFIVDTGVEKALRDAPEKAALRGMVASYMNIERFKFHMPLGDWLAKQPAPLAGVFFTHIHLDHITGLPDVPRGTPLYAGPGETSERAFLNLFVKPNVDRAFEGQSELREWGFTPDPDGRFAGLIDVFGDRSLWAIHMPGHTPGSTAYLARTPDGPVLMTGDTCHTTWGWNHDVEPGSFTSDHTANADSLARLRRLVREHPAISVRLGHQDLHASGVARR